MTFAQMAPRNVNFSARSRQLPPQDDAERRGRMAPTSANTMHIYAQVKKAAAGGAWLSSWWPCSGRLRHIRSCVWSTRVCHGGSFSKVFLPNKYGTSDILRPGLALVLMLRSRRLHEVNPSLVEHPSAVPEIQKGALQASKVVGLSWETEVRSRLSPLFSRPWQKDEGLARWGRTR